MYILFHKYKDCLLLSILYVSSYDLTQSFEHASPLHCCNLLTHQHNKHLISVMKRTWMMPSKTCSYKALTVFNETKIDFNKC